MSRKIYCENEECEQIRDSMCCAYELNIYSNENGDFVCGSRTDLMGREDINVEDIEENKKDIKKEPQDCIDGEIVGDEEVHYNF